MDADERRFPRRLRRDARPANSIFHAGMAFKNPQETRILLVAELARVPGRYGKSGDFLYDPGDTARSRFLNYD